MNSSMRTVVRPRELEDGQPLAVDVLIGVETRPSLFAGLLQEMQGALRATRRMSVQFRSIRSTFTLRPTSGGRSFGTPARSKT